MIDQIMVAEAKRRFDPLAARQATLRKQSEGWRAFQGIAAKLRDSARALSESKALETFRTTVTRPASAKDVVGAIAGVGAAAGSYAVEVLAVAQAEKLGGAVATTATTALGVSGSFALNGRTVTVSATDSLNALRDKINAAHAGSGAEGVSATVQATSGGFRLVLTASSTGAAGISTIDDGAGTLAALGLSDGTRVSNFGPDGAARTQHVSSATMAVAALLGVPLPTPSTVRVGGTNISVDLNSDSLSSIAAKINLATGNADAARVRSETVGSTTRYWLETDATVEIDTNDAAASTRTLDVLGFTRAGRANVAQVVASANQFVDDATGLAATGTTTLANLRVNGQLLGFAEGDVVNIAGTRGDGSSVTRSFTVGAGSTMADLLGAIGDAGSGFGAGTRTAAAGLSDGRITLTDSTAGSSALGVSLTVARAAGGSVSLGAFGTTHGTAGRDRLITAGGDAVLRVDGQLLRRSSNTITDAIAGVTLTANVAEAGTIATVEVARDADGAARLLQDFATQYNAVRSWITTNSAAGGPLAGNGALRSMATSLTSQMLTSVVGVTGSYTTSALAGLEHDKNGVLSVNLETFKKAYAADPTGIQRLFSKQGSATDADVSFVASSAKTKPTASGYAVQITQAATKASVTGASFATYATAGAPDTMTLTDASAGRSTSISLANGDTVASIVQRLNAAFAADGLRLTAELTDDDRVRITSKEYGTEGSFTVAYTPGAGGDGTALLGLAAGTTAGLDVAGTINGAAATGLGQVLTGTEGDTEGLAIQYSGTTARAAGSITYTEGVGGMLHRIAQAIAADGSGASLQMTTSANQADAFGPRLDDIQKRLDARKESLVRQFVAMEAAIAKSQALGNALASQIAGLGAQV